MPSSKVAVCNAQRQTVPMGCSTPAHLMLQSSASAEVPTGPGSRIKSGDEVIVYLAHGEMQSAVVDTARIFDCRFGAFPMKDWLEKQFGCKQLSKTGGKYIYLLAPTPELWTLVLRHRTQLLYAADISLITSNLELRPGSTVLESGTGSGSLTHALARAIAPGGHVHTFEFHSQRANEAEREFSEHGLSEVVTVCERDAERDGFPKLLHGRADAVFLDLPGPWKVVPSAAACLRGDGVFCAFSPCIEQVQRTCGALAQAGFYNVRTVECLLRRHEVVKRHLNTDLSSTPPPVKKRRRGFDSEDSSQKPSEHTAVKPLQDAKGHTGYLTFARRIVEEDAPEAPASPTRTDEGELVEQ